MTAAKPLVICLMGPTASGKTDLAIELAAARGCELISVDSALVYRGLDIGSAKPAYPHHLIDIRDPAEIYSAADFVADASRLIADITRRGKTPLLVGGTMLYFRALLQGLAAMPPADPDTRAAIESEAAALGWPHLHAELARVDPLAAAQIHPNHSQRLSRALEVYRFSGTPLSEWHANQPPSPLSGYRTLQVAICPEDRAVLHRRIALRFEQMMEAGFLDEVRALYTRGDLHTDLPALRAVGYRQLWQFLAGEVTEVEAVERGIAATRQLAKRQLTWLRKWPDLQWVVTDSAGNLSAGALSEKAMGDIGHKPSSLVLNYIDQPPLS